MMPNCLGLKGGWQGKSFIDRHSKNVLFLEQVSNGRSFQPEALFEGRTDALSIAVGGIRERMIDNERSRGSYGF